MSRRSHQTPPLIYLFFYKDYLMAIDMKKLKEISQGDPDDKVMVRREWLQEVYRLLSEEEAEDDLSVFDKIFGEKGMFDTIFGRDRKHYPKSKFLP